MSSMVTNREHAIKGGTDLVPVRFRPIRVVEPESVGQFLHYIERSQANRSYSYGARLIKGGGETVVKQCCEWLESKKNASLNPSPFSVNSALHKDFGSENDVTVHVTEAGQAEMVVLVGSYFKEGTRHPDRETITNQLFDSSAVNTARLTLPYTALRSELSAGDVVLLDHSQPHAVRGLGDGRSSVAYF